MLVQPTEDYGEQSKRPSEPQLTPSPPHPSEVHVEPQSGLSPRPSPTTHIPVKDQAKEIKHLKAQIKKLQKRKPNLLSHTTELG
ncbi:hypothetical protein Tco_0358320 [Tanacetum coccineum]